jgi:hypothetical protein
MIFSDAIYYADVRRKLRSSNQFTDSLVDRTSYP